MRWFCRCAYDGTDYEGWQSQISGRTVQDFIERRLEQLFGRKIRIHAAGRTDAGVHARGQAFTFDGDWSHSVEALQRALRCGFPKTIQIFDIQQVPPAFHGRYSARWKRYSYRIHCGEASPFICRFCLSLGQRRPHVEAMRSATKVFVGRKDFALFGGSVSADGTEETVKTIHRADLLVRKRDLIFVVEGSGFLYRMVRRMVGAILDLGFGKLTCDELVAMVDCQRQIRPITTAPAKGLTLEYVSYDEWSRASLGVSSGTFPAIALE